MWEKRFFLNEGAKERERALSLSAEIEKVTDFVQWAEGVRGLESQCVLEPAGYWFFGDYIVFLSSLAVSFLCQWRSQFR